ncbi:MAG: putative DNA binding domain-containing protein [Erysipelotrichaceae bacterium]
MFSIEDLRNTRETISFEGKRAKNGLPNSIWETYSAFCNTIGGTILLGIDEKENGYFSVCGIEDSRKLINDFWNLINNKKKVSINLLMDHSIRIEEVEGKEIIIIEVPRAKRENKPVYINDNLFGGTYRRNGDGDYHCSRLEVKNMLRDQVEVTNDFRIVEEFEMDVLEKETIRAYRNLFTIHKPGHPWAILEDNEFLYRISAAGKTSNGIIKPTVAGLLLFSHDYEIERIYNQYFLDYQERSELDERWTNRISSDQGNWSGNLFDFFFKIYPLLSNVVPVPFEIGNEIYRIDENKTKIALREALINCICNADFHNSKGIVIKLTSNSIVFENPGIMRFPLDKAIEGGTSDPRNKAMMKIFSLIGLAEKAGSGIPEIFSTWKALNLKNPEFSEEYNPDRTCLELNYHRYTSNVKESNSEYSIMDNRTRDVQIIDFIRKNGFCCSRDVERMFKIKSTRARIILKEMVEKEMIVVQGANKNRTYILK